MRGLQIARVAVIDEDPKEATVLLAALGRMGIAAAYFDGTPQSVPAKPLSGIRVVFLDLNLNGLTEPKQFLPHTVQVLRAAVSFEPPNSVVIVAWTTHEDTLDELKQHLDGAGIRPASIVSISDKFGLVAEHSIDAIIERIRTEYNTAHQARPGARLLLDWEHEVSAAAADVARLFEAWSKGANLGDPLTALATLANALRDSADISPKEAIVAAMEGLNSILADSLLATAVNHFAVEPHATALQSEMRANPKSKLSEDARARLNQILMTCQVSGKGPRLGDVYLRSDDADPWPFPCGPLPRADFIKAATGSQWLSANTGEPTDANNAIHKAAAKAWPILVEISPACDHQQGKLRQHRLIGGMLIPCQGIADADAKIDVSKNNQLFARVLPSMFLDSPLISYNGTVKLLLDGRSCTVLSPTGLTGWRPVLRLRAGVVADLQAWVASYAARPGFVAVT